VKKNLILAIAALFLTLPFVLSAKTAIPDSELDAVTAEEGVSITFTNVTVGGAAALTVASWGDEDGFSGYTSAGYAGMNAVTIGGTLTALNGTADIDVGTSGSTTMMRFVMPTVTMGSMNVAATLKLSNSQNLSGGNVLGNLGISGFSTRMTGNIGVYAH
jgi:hypothetical protein